MSATGNPQFRRRDEVDFQRQLAAARAGCPEALGQLLQGCRRYLLLSAGRALDSTLRPKEGVSDLVQQTFVVAHRHFQSFRGTSLGELLSWLNRILEHRLANQVRRYKLTSKRTVRREVELNAGGHTDRLGLVDQRLGPSDDAALGDERQRVQRAMERLSDVYRQVLMLRAWQRLPFAEIARQMHRSPAAVEKLWARAVERLEVELRTVK
jgi:RNA polymerase sigma-70 factor (ECF subfamily)